MKHKESMIPTSDCPTCLKPEALCICSEIRSLSTKLKVLILQHPQEPDHELGTAKITQLSLSNCTLKVGLSWPNLKAALGDAQAQSSQWAVLYLGSGIKGKATADQLQFVNKKGEPVAAPSTPIQGVILLDGTWSQAKALWWRNAWLLKLKRVILMPKEKSLYGNLRKEPRKECLSTLESAAECLVALGEPEEIRTQLKQTFQALLDRRKALKQSKKP